MVALARVDPIESYASAPKLEKGAARPLRGYGRVATGTRVARVRGKGPLVPENLMEVIAGAIARSVR
jgi:hypothetical protein